MIVLLLLLLATVHSSITELLREHVFVEDRSTVYSSPMTRLTPEESDELGKICGIRSGKTHKIHNGELARLGQFPWAAALTWKPGKRSYCTGTLISDRHILAAAHCFFSKTTKQFIRNGTVHLYVNVGGICNYEADECDHETYGYAAPTQSLKIVSTMLIREYIDSSREIGGDMAVAKLQNPVQFNNRTYPICLPAPTLQLSDDKATHWGYGHTERFNHSVPSLHFMSTRLVNCETAFPRPIQSYSDDCVCSMSSQDQKIEAGDSGSALEVVHRGRTYSLGTLSFSYISNVTHAREKGDCSTDNRQYAEQICEATGVCYMLDEELRQ